MEKPYVKAGSDKSRALTGEKNMHFEGMETWIHEYLENTVKVRKC